MKIDLQAHLLRLREGVNNVHTLSNLAPWIEKYTYLDGKRFSFAGHEFQRDILADEAKTSIVVKCAQVGLSEALYRYAVAACATQDDFTCIYTFPTSTDAEKNNKTRIDPMIESSAELKRLVNPNLNNSEIKQFGRNSFLFFKGTMSGTQALSTPANAIINDEYDASDITTASVYVSRLQHKPHKIRKIFSTPTTDGYGISKEAETARRMRHFAKCAHCNHLFLPDYFKDVVVPGWDKSLEEITKETIHTTNWRDAYLKCPKCGQDPDLHHERMQFVCENPAEKHEANAWYVTPFSAHTLITPSYLVNTSTKYKKFSEFKNQALGLTGQDKSEAIMPEDIDAVAVSNLGSTELHVLGADMGLMCHVTIGRIAHDGSLLVVHAEKVHYTMFEERTRELAVQYRVYCGVMDTMPYTDLVTRISKARPNWWGAIFTTSKIPVAYVLQTEEEDISEGKMTLRLVKVNRNIALDEVLSVIKSQKIAIQRNDQFEDFKKQMTSLKKIQKFTKDGELTYVWEKTGDENDHFHFSLLYLYLATQIRGTAGGSGFVSANMGLVYKIKDTKVKI